MISDDIKLLQQQRFQYLYELYKESDGDELNHFDFREIGKLIGYEEKLSLKLANYLSSEGLLKWVALGGIISITHRGIKEMEYALQYPDQSTPHFIPINQLNITIGQNINSPIIANSPRASQNTNINSGNRTEIIDQFQKWKESLKDLDMNTKDKQKLESYAEIVEDEILSEKPNKELLTQCVEKSDKLIHLAHNAGTALTMLVQLKTMLGIH